MKQLYLSIALILLSSLAFGQKVKKTSGEFLMNLRNTGFSEEEACQACIERAKIDAIEKAFGSVVIQGNSTYIENVNTGNQVETTDIFHTIAETMVNGRWIETLDENCERIEHEGDWWMECKVKGRVQELEHPEIDFEVKTLDCENAKCETSMFREGESLFMYLKSPVAGYISIYLTDKNMAQRLLPYSNPQKSHENGMLIEPDKEYILFSAELDAFGLGRYDVDEYELYAENDKDFNRIFIIYSEQPMNKPLLEKDAPEHTDASIAQRYEMPSHLEIQDFHRWLAKNYQYQDRMQVERIDIVIQK